MERSLFLT